ncbi:MAG: hypothetical protein ACRD96_15265, partial [Bryobacteraceae bacterium]
MTLLPLLFLAAATQTINVDRQPVRSGCADADPIVATLPAGTKVKVGFSLAGAARPCFLIVATIDNKTVQGYVPAEALTGAEEMERDRQTAAPVAVTTNAGGAPSAPRANGKGNGSATIGIPLIPHPEAERAIDLLKRNQPEQALAIVERLMQKYPQQPGLL